MIHRMFLAGVIACGFAWAAAADTVKFHGTMAGTSESPPTKSPGTGEATATLDTATKLLTWDVTFGGFGSPVTMAHFHGPAAPGANAKVQVPIAMNPASPLHGSATLTDDQVKQLMAGQWYVNVHTTDNPGGAVRGQMTKE